jgi:Tat protein translocase TatB subunit
MGWQEILLTAIVVLIFVKPEEMPSLMKKAGQFIGQTKRKWQEFQDDIDRTEHNLRIKALEGMDDVETSMKSDFLDAKDDSRNHVSKK